MPDTPEEVRRVVAEQRRAGFTAVKLGWGPLGRSAELDVALVAAAREAAGEEVELMVDLGKGWSGAGDAIERARSLAAYRPLWLEEPFMPDEYERYSALARTCEVPIAAGEEETTAWDFERLADAGGVAIVQPDVTRVGGISEAMRVAEMARGRGLRFVPHAWSTGIIKAATLQVLAASHEADWFEYCVQSTPLNEALVRERFPLVDGYVEIPDRPGLGVELDEDRLAECLVAADV